MPTRSGPTDDAPQDRDESPDERADRNWSELLQEFRVTQTGTQFIAGFLLTIPFQQRFTLLSSHELIVYMSLVFLAALATAVGLSAVGLHRGLFRRHRKPLLVSTGNRLLQVNLAITALLTAGIVLLITEVVTGDALIGWLCGGAVLIVLIVMLWVVPRFERHVK